MLISAVILFVICYVIKRYVIETPEDKNRGYDYKTQILLNKISDKCNECRNELSSKLSKKFEDQKTQIIAIKENTLREKKNGQPTTFKTKPEEQLGVDKISLNSEGGLINWQNNRKYNRCKMTSKGGKEGSGFINITFIEDNSGDYVIDNMEQCYPLDGNKFKTTGNEVYLLLVVSKGKDWGFEKIATCKKINEGWELKEQGKIIRPHLNI